jgi:hypothetical protein
MRPFAPHPELLHMRNTLVRFGHILQTIPHFPALGNKIIYGSMTSSAVISLSNFRSAIFAFYAFT